MIEVKNNVSNCPMCQKPFSFSLVSTIYSFPCSHQMHRNCLVQWTNYIHTTQPTAKTLSCPVCRKITQIPTKHSAEQISDWVKIAKRVIVSTGTILGGGVGLSIATIAKDSSGRND